MRELVYLGLLMLSMHITGMLSPAQNIDIAFILDSSSLISSDKWKTVKKFITTCVGAVDIKTGKVRVAVIEFSTRANLSIKLGEFKTHQHFARAVDQMPFLNQRTNVSGAIRLVYRQVLTRTDLRRSARRVMVVLTNGESNADRHLTSFVSDGARKSGVRVFSVGVGKTINSNIMQEIASRPYYYFVWILNDYAALIKYTKRLTRAIFSDQYPKKEIRPKFSDCAADVIFVVDVSAPWSYAVQDTIAAIAGSMLKLKRSPYRVLLVRPIISGSGRIWKRKGFTIGQTLQYVRSAISSNTVHKRPNAAGIIVVVSNRIYSEAELIKQEVQMMKSKGIIFVVIALGKARHDRVLYDMTSEPKTRTFLKMSKPETLSEQFNRYRKEGSLRKFPVIANTCKISSVLLWSCNFEKNEPFKCNMTGDGKADFTWTVWRGPTRTAYTGPDSAWYGEYYLLMEASHAKRSGDKAIMYLPFSDKGVFCLSFHYHMFGLDMGILDVFIVSEKQERIIWRMSGYKGSDWRYGEVLMLLHQKDKIGIRGVRGAGRTSDIGLDLLRIRKGTCVGDV